MATAELCCACGNPNAINASLRQVRVSRRRILDSAQKVLELYGGSRMILELEFFGEVGTGLGPTLEFYTLLAHELQV